MVEARREGQGGLAGLCFGYLDMLITTVVSLAPAEDHCSWSAWATTGLQLCAGSVGLLQGSICEEEEGNRLVRAGI